jgi:hypothetical protein
MLSVFMIRNCTVIMWSAMIMKFSIIIMRAIIMGVDMLNSFISSVIKINVVLLNVMAPKNCRTKRQKGCHSLSYRNKDDPTAVG